MREQGSADLGQPASCSEMVHSFKQVAIHQADEERHTFELGGYCPSWFEARPLLSCQGLSRSNTRRASSSTVLRRAGPGDQQSRVQRGRACLSRWRRRAVHRDGQPAGLSAGAIACADQGVGIPESCSTRVRPVYDGRERGTSASACTSRSTPSCRTNGPLRWRASPVAARWWRSRYLSRPERSCHATLPATTPPGPPFDVHRHRFV